MYNVSFGNTTLSNNQTLSPELQKRIQDGENFTAIDKEKLKQDTVQLTQKTVKENFIYRALKNIGVEDPKKTLKSVLMTAVTIVGVATLGNKFSNKAADLGLKVDGLISKSDFLKNAGTGIKKAKDNVGNFLTSHFKTINNISETLKKRKVKPTNQFAASAASGPKFQFASAVIESMQGIFYGDTKKLASDWAEKIEVKGKKLSATKFDKETLRKLIAADDIETKMGELGVDITDPVTKDKFINAIDGLKEKHMAIFEKMVGEGDEGKEIYRQIVEDDAGDRVQFVNNFINKIREKHGTGGNAATNAELLKFFKTIQKGDTGFEECKDILMCHGMDSWVTTNWIDDLGNKIFKNKWKNVSKANVGSALIKYSATTGQLADTAAGKFVQGFPTLFTESISNYVCDMAFINAMVIPSFIELFNNVQDAPKEQKTATLAKEFVGGVGSFTLVMPTAAAITYGIASLRNLDSSKSLLSKPLKLLGKVFGIGLTGAGGKAKPKWFARFGGGAFRFFMIMFALSPLISKPIDALVQKVFGKAYDPEEAQKAKQLEEQKKQVIPELGITQGELMDKIQKNPQALEKLQTNPELIKEMEKNPKILLDILDNKEVKIEPKKSTYKPGTVLSPANKNRLGSATNMQTPAQVKQPSPNLDNQANLSKKADGNVKNSNQTEEVVNVDTATYIPSSQFTASTANLSQEQQSKYDTLMSNADIVLKEAEKYI